ncbi:MAG: hypothetical protein ACYDHM_07680 [Acidiferrobacterales bacterium]
MATNEGNPFKPKGTTTERRASLERIKEFSPTFKTANLAALDKAAFETVEKAVIREARENLRNSGRLFEFIERDRTGREISRFEGDPGAWMKPFQAAPVAIRFNRNVGTHKETIRVPDGKHAGIVGGPAK